MPRKRPSKGSDLQGNAWAFASVNDARAVYQTALAKPGIISNTHDSSLETGFFASRPVLVFAGDQPWIQSSWRVSSVSQCSWEGTSWRTH